MLTDRAIQATMRRCTKETVLRDSDGTRGGGVLALRIRPGDAGATATWVAMWELAGKRGSKALGRYPETSLHEARDTFHTDVRAMLLQGKAPSKAQAMGEGATVEALCKAYHQHLVDRGKRRADEYKRILLTGKWSIADKLGRNRLAASITPSDVADALKITDARGARRQADIERTTMVAMFNYAIRSTHDYRAASRVDWGVKVNPAAVIPRDTGAVVARDRHLTADEMRAVWLAGTDDAGDVLRLVMCCGQRVMETLRIEGRDVDLQARIWRQPAHKTKGGTHAHAIPLPAQAVEIIARRVEVFGDGLLFPARAGAKRGKHMTAESVSRAAARLNVCAPFTPRDLRRTWKSRAGEAGIDRFTRDLIQQHARGDTGSKHYDHTDYMPQMRGAMAKWQVWLDKHVLRVGVVDMSVVWRSC